MNPSPPDTNADVARAQAGEEAAFGRLVDRHAEPLWRSARALCRDDQEAEDLAQETLVEAWRSLRRFDGRAAFSTWLYGILRHRFLKSRRKRRPSPVDAEQVGAGPSRDSAPPAAAEQAEAARLVQAAVASLPDEHRAVLELRFFAGASLGEIAVALGCPLGTVKSRLHHGLEKLRLANVGANLFEGSGDSSRCEPRALQ